LSKESTETFQATPITPKMIIGAISFAILSEIIEPGASMGLCMLYTIGLILTKTQNTQNIFLNLLLFTIPITMTHQRNLGATLILCFGIWYWLKRTDHLTPPLKLLNPQISKFKGYLFYWSPIILLSLLTLWIFVIEAIRVYNKLGSDFSWGLNMLGTLGLTLIWIPLCGLMSNSWKLTLPLLATLLTSLLILYGPQLIPSLPTSYPQFESLIHPILSHKNNIATLGTISLSILCYSFLNNKSKKIIPWICLNSLLLLITPSRLGSFSTMIIISLLITNLIWESQAKQLKKILLSAFTLLTCLTAIGINELIRHEIHIRNEASGNKPYDSSTGRLKIWETTFTISENKILGNGSSHWAQEGTPKMIDHNNFPAENTHNSFLEIWLAYGPIGLFLFCATLVSLLLIAKSTILKTMLLALGPLLPMLVESYSWAWGGTPVLSLWAGFCYNCNNCNNCNKNNLGDKPLKIENKK
jgi:hypothetical protein